jgi:hypothetical protein
MRGIYEIDLQQRYLDRDPDALDLLIGLRKVGQPAQFGDEMGQPLRSLAQVVRKGSRNYGILRFE